MTTINPPEFAGPLDRQLSPISYTTSDPTACLNWLCAIGGTRQPTRGPREAGRVQTLGGGLEICYASGLVIALGPDELATVRSLQR